MRLRGAAGLAVALIVLGSGPALGGAPDARAAGPQPGHPSAEGGRQHAVSLVIESITPKAAAPTSKISLAGYVQNATGQPIAGMTIRLRYSPRALASRAELEQQASAGAPGLPGQTAHPQQFRQAVAAGAKQAWDLETSSKELGFRAFGVYPLSVEINDASGRVLGAQRTFLTYVPKNYKQQLKPTKIAWVWPLLDQPHRTIDSHFRDDRLAAAFAPDGRLTGLLTAAHATKTPLTWAIDPALIDDARTMTRPYTVQTSPKAKETPKPKSAAAERWLTDLKAAAAGDPYFAMPYADTDVVALVRRGRTADLKTAYGPASTQAVRDTLGGPSEPVAWPPEGVADQNTLNQLSRLGNKVFLLTSDVLPGNPNLTYTPSAAVAMPMSGGTKYAVAGDRTISTVIGGDTRSPGAALLTEQRFLAETAMITAERPLQQRTVLVVPPRRWNPSPSFAAQLLTDTSAAHWLQPTTLADVTRAAVPERTFAGYPAAYQTHELSASYLASVRAIRTQALRFSGIFDPPLTGYQFGVLRLESSAWRGKRAAKQARRARDALKAQLADDTKTVHFVLNKGPSLAGEIGQVPVTIANDMPGHTLTVYLGVSSANPRLQIGDFPRMVTIPPEKKVTIQIPMKAAANGKTDVTLTLLTKQDKPIGVVRNITVNATGFGRTALLITGGALVVLFLGVARAMRARRRNGAKTRQTATTSEPRPPNGTLMPSGRRSDHGTAGSGATSGPAPGTTSRPPPGTTSGPTPGATPGATPRE